MVLNHTSTFFRLIAPKSLKYFVLLELYKKSANFLRNDTKTPVSLFPISVRRDLLFMAPSVRPNSVFR